MEITNKKYDVGWEYIFAENLKYLRLKQKRMTQKKLAGKLGVNRKTYSHYERGRRTPPIWFILDTANYFSVTVDLLIKEHISSNDKELNRKIEDITYNDT